MDENNPSVNPTGNQGNVPTPKEDNNKLFTAEQQEKVNSLIKEERMRIFTQLGIANVEEGKKKLEKASKVDEYETKIQDYEEKMKVVTKLSIDNAILTNNIDESNREVVEYYFKGKGEELNSENLKKLLEEKPTLKAQWSKVIPTNNPQPFGNPQPQDKPSTQGYDEFRKFTKY